MCYRIIVTGGIVVQFEKESAGCIRKDSFVPKSIENF
jgi:hypothetical protein